MTKPTAIKPKQSKGKKYMLVRYGRMNTLGWFEHNEARVPKVPQRVVIKTERGQELGQIVGQLCPYKGGQFKLSQEQIEKYYQDSEVDFPFESAGKFIRYATGEDISEENHLKRNVKDEIECCRRFVKELDLPMKIVDAEHIFGGERIVFYFTSDGRVDFRELVKKLAPEYQTRIEMRQIGPRDEAKILGDVESCGQQCCCIRFLKILKPVNMRMAKIQKATLDPSKISGYCGRLKCCLRYEDQAYSELKRRLPKKNSRVRTSHGEGRVVGTQILTQLVMIELDDATRIAVGVDEIEVTAPPERIEKKQVDAPSEQEQNEPDSDELQDKDEAKDSGQIQEDNESTDNRSDKEQ